MAAPRFSETIGREVLVKRDDVGSMGYAGNKIRKLELIVARADAEGVEAFAVVGALQSNAARTVAAVAAATGRRCVIVVPDAPQPLDEADGNLMLSLLFGAEVRFVGRMDWAEAEQACRAVSEEFAAGGVRCMALPTGCSTALGAAAFVAAHRELLVQLDALGCSVGGIVHASSSGGTAAGLHLGRLLHGGPPVLSIDVGRLFDDVVSHIAGLATEAASVLGLERRVCVSDVNLSFDFMGEAYGQPTEDGLAAIRLLARTEGIVCDMVYTGKALGAVCAGAGANGDLPVVFWHTGGVQSVLSRHARRQLLDA